MRKVLYSVALAAMAGSLPLLSAPALAQAAPAEGDRYSVSKTLVGTLLDDPAAAAVLEKMIPTVYANPMFQDAGRALSLKDIQQYEPEVLNDDNLAKIQAELDKLPVKK